MGRKAEDVELIDPSLLTVFRRERLSNKDNEEETSTNLMDKLIAKTVEIALKEGVIEVKNKIIQDSTHTNAMYQHISPREELIKQAKELRKAVYKIDETMHDTEYEIEYSKDKDAQMYVCKAGHMAIKKQKQKIKNLQNKESFTEVESYFFDIEKCKHCPYKEGCYKNGAKSKTYNVTIKNSELKSRFGYDKDNVCGKTGITIQGASALFLANIKRIIKLKEEKVQNNV